MPMTIYPWHNQAWVEVLRLKATLPHAVLFRGREGIGKLDFVRKLAQSMSCESPEPDGAACGKCRSCRWFVAGTHPDYREIQPEILRPVEADAPAAGERKPSQRISVDEVRDLQGFISLSAHQRGGKTIVFCPAESLNVNAANALLKNLEEPPAGTRFFLVSHRPSYLPATIISRCQQFALPAPSRAVAEHWLREQGIAEPMLSLAQTGNAPLAALTLDDAEFWTQRKSLLDNLAESKIDPIVLAERVRDFPVARMLGWLQRWTYDLLSAKSVGRVRYNPDFAAALKRIAGNLQATNIVRYHRVLLDRQRTVQHPLNSRLFIEDLLLSYSSLLRGDTQAGGHAG